MPALTDGEVAEFSEATRARMQRTVEVVGWMASLPPKADVLAGTATIPPRP